jgi:hypothetical protein
VWATATGVAANRFRKKEESMKVSVELITPEIASEILSFNTRNRKLRQSVVDRYAAEMKAGRWLETHQGIAINCDGTLLDGQHRLAAIVQSGIAQKMVVTRSVPSSSQIAMDDHAKRSPSDSISLDRGTLVTSTVVAIARAVTRASTGDNTAISTQEAAEVIDKISAPLGFVAPFLVTKQRGVTCSSVWAAIVLSWFYANDLERLAQFCRILCGQEMAESESDKAAVMLREWLLRTGAPTSAKHDAFKKTQRAIVAFLEGKGIGKLYGTDVYYPWPLIDPVR